MSAPSAIPVTIVAWRRVTGRKCLGRQADVRIGNALRINHVAILIRDDVAGAAMPGKVVFIEKRRAVKDPEGGAVHLPVVRSVSSAADRQLSDAVIAAAIERSGPLEGVL